MTQGKDTTIEALAKLFHQGKLSYVEQVVLDDFVQWKQTDDPQRLQWVIDNLTLIFRAKQWEMLAKEREK